MKFDIDTYREILDTLTRNKTRSFLTGFGVFWGVFMLVVLIGGGDGLEELLSKNFQGFATNSAFTFAQPTTKPYEGFRKGRQWNMTYRDVERLRAHVPELDIVTPLVTEWGKTFVAGDKKFVGNVKGIYPEYAKVEEPTILYGRYLNDMDIAEDRKVCVIGKKVYKTLFPNGGDPCGQLVRVDSLYFNVVGVDYSPGNMNINGNVQESVTIPLTIMQRVYNLGDVVHIICVTGKPGVTMGKLAQPLREVIGRAHRVDPTDEKAISVFNTEVMYGMVDSLFKGVNFLIWLVGIGTLLAGGIGVSNIMMVTVRERTTEIGIRRAIGATPKMILSQIVSESIALTTVAGMSGILLAVFVLQMLEVANTTDGIMAAHFQIGFWAALGALAFLCVLGVVAGLAPAIRAMSIKPVDAMRDE
ncbi:efflux ABC transporter, permease protein [Hallella bergensis DSM 17361]|uniref:Efflux ABC transporter, permease protein n=1 Tax=Hallella bergensis DSM 17361 TaxID=585502 RepID=D1PUA0_9BACT|nr:ABC transporter permease [Hallella bergensis]EFA45012.1 efflux ABC transporter, permease protein [Hallella bergensis DSM 17361]